MSMQEAQARQAVEDATTQSSSQPKPSESSAAQPKAAEDDDGLVMDVVKSTAFKDFMRTAAREIARGMFKSGRR